MALALLKYSAADRRKSDPTPWRSRLFAPSQLAFFDDPSRRKTALCTRRAGKTEADTSTLEQAIVDDPTRIALYLTLTAQTSRDNQESRLTHANLIDGLGLQYDANQGSPRWWDKRGGCIWLAGCKDKREADKYRGLPYSKVIIDEGGTHRSEILSYLISDVLGPALTDNDGQLILTGTPGARPKGYFYEASTEGGKLTQPWSQHSWSVTANPYHPFGRDAAALEAHRIERGLELTDPTWRREYCAEWALDLNAIIYHYGGTLNAWNSGDELPAGNKLKVLSIDLGYDDDCAFVVTESTYGFPTIVVRESFGKPGLLPGDIAAEIHRIQGRHPDTTQIVCDMGGLGKTIGIQLQRDYGIPIVPAEKQDKAGAIKRVQAALKAGHLKLARAAMGLLDEWQELPWDEKRMGHAEGFIDHQSDALLYGVRCHPMFERWEKDPPAEGSAEARAEEVRKIKAAAAKPKTKRWR